MSQVVWNNKTSATLKLSPPVLPLQHPSPILWSSLGKHIPLPSMSVPKLIPVVNKMESLKELIDQVSSVYLLGIKNSFFYIIEADKYKSCLL